MDLRKIVTCQFTSNVTMLSQFKNATDKDTGKICQVVKHGAIKRITARQISVSMSSDVAPSDVAPSDVAPDANVTIFGMSLKRDGRYIRVNENGEEALQQFTEAMYKSHADIQPKVEKLLAPVFEWMLTTL